MSSSIQVMKKLSQPAWPNVIKLRPLKPNNTVSDDFIY